MAMDLEDKYLHELLAEKDRLDPSLHHTTRLLCKEIEIVKAGNPSASSSAEQVHLTEKVFVPAKDFPGYNFVGRLLGPRGLTLKRMQSETGCRLTIMGRGSIRDAAEEDSLRQSGEAKYMHLSEDLHVFVEAKGSENIAAARLAAGIAEIRKMLIPGDANDQIRNEQLRELALLNGLKETTDVLASAKDSDFPPRDGMAMARVGDGGGRVRGGGGGPRHMANSRQPEMYATSNEAQEYAPVIMVPRGYERMQPTVAYAKPEAFGASYIERATYPARLGEYVAAEGGAMQMMPASRHGGSATPSSWAKSSRPPKRFHPYTTSSVHY